jgi:AcrR family transcriptional regulator
MYAWVVAREKDDEQLGAAARALADAVSLLTKAVGQGLTEASQEVGTQLASSLREASRELAEASAEAGRRAGDQRRRARTERTRAALLDAARSVFAEKGYEGASVGDVAMQAGFTKGAVYANFGGKEELLLNIARGLAQDDAAYFAAQDDADLHAVFTTGDDESDQLARTLLALEVYTYAVRHAEARTVIGPLVGSSWQHAAQLLHRRAGGAGEPSQEARDTALALLAVHTFVQVLGPVLGDEDIGAVGSRLAARLLDDA